MVPLSISKKKASLGRDVACVVIADQEHRLIFVWTLCIPHTIARIDDLIPILVRPYPPLLTLREIYLLPALGRDIDL